MTDHNELREAFTTLEDRADAYVPAERQQTRRAARPLLIAATVVTVLAVAVLGAVLLRPGHRSTGQAGGEAPSTAPSVGETFSTEQPSSSPPVDSTTPTTPSTTSAPTQPRSTAPGGTTAQTFAQVLHQVAGERAGYTANGESNGTFLLGTVTVAGASGGFDFQYFHTDPSTTATCDDTDRVTCHVSSPAGGGSLATGTESLQQAPGGITHQVTYVRRDGTEFVMHVSNAADPKGAGAVGATVPLTIDQMVAIVSSDAWH